MDGVEVVPNATALLAFLDGDDESRCTFVQPLRGCKSFVGNRRGFRAQGCGSSKSHKTGCLL